MKKMKTAVLFTPFALCVFLSILGFINETSMGDAPQTTFFAFLPICFLLGSYHLVAMNKRIAELEDRLKQAGEGSS